MRTVGSSTAEHHEGVTHHITCAKLKQSENRQHPERLQQVGHRLAEVVRSYDPPEVHPSPCAAAMTYGASITHFDPPDGTNIPSTAEYNATSGGKVVGVETLHEQVRRVSRSGASR